MDKVASMAERIQARPGKKWRRFRPTPESIGCNKEEVMDETVSKAERIRASREIIHREVPELGLKLPTVTRTNKNMDKVASMAERIQARPGKKWRRFRPTPESIGCNKEEVMDETVSKAERIRASREIIHREVPELGLKLPTVTRTNKNMDKVASMAERIQARPGKKWRRFRPTPESIGCNKEEVMDETVSKAERIRASRGNYEAEVSFTGELGLQQCRIMCQKNPGHQNFIPTNNFNIEHLPSCYRDNLLVDYVRATSDVTCRLSVSRISKDRPKTWPGSSQVFPFSEHKEENFTITGTAWVRDVEKFPKEEKKPCECDECLSPGTRKPKRTWGRVYIRTAGHVVNNSEEARHTKCQFFYDSHETDINKVLTLTGLRVVDSDVKGDWCQMVYVTHDMELLDRLYKIWNHRWYLYNKLYQKYCSKMDPCLRVSGVECKTNVKHDLCIIVSHPHGCSKQISVGTWTHRDLVYKNKVWENITYRYNTPTCPGSSGAAVFTLSSDNTRELLFYILPPHSEGQIGNDNNSGVGVEREDYPFS